MADYKITIEGTGSFDIVVNARSVKQAEKYALEAYYKYNFGEFNVTDGKVVKTEDISDIIKARNGIEMFDAKQAYDKVIKIKECDRVKAERRKKDKAWNFPNTEEYEFVMNEINTAIKSRRMNVTISKKFCDYDFEAMKDFFTGYGYQVSIKKFNGVFPDEITIGWEQYQKLS